MIGSRNELIDLNCPRAFDLDGIDFRVFNNEVLAFCNLIPACRVFSGDNFTGLRIDVLLLQAVPRFSVDPVEAHLFAQRRRCEAITDDYGAEFASHSDSLAYRTIGIYVFLRTVMCSPVRASQIAHALKLPRVSVVRRLGEMIKHGYVERVGNAYRVTDKVNIPDLQGKLQRRIDMVTETAKRVVELSAGRNRPAAVPIPINLVRKRQAMRTWRLLSRC